MQSAVTSYLRLSGLNMLPDRQQLRRTLALAGGMVVLLILLVALTVLWHRAEDEHSATQAARIKAKEQAKIAKDQRLIAQSAQGVAEKRQTPPSVL